MLRLVPSQRHVLDRREEEAQIFDLAPRPDMPMQAEYVHAVINNEFLDAFNAPQVGVSWAFEANVLQRFCAFDATF